MINAILHEIEMTQSINPQKLSERLKIHPRLVKSMLETLIELGYLSEIDTCSDTHCQGCPIAGSCSTKEGKARLWKVREL
jgi:hypothetical protein